MTLTKNRFSLYRDASGYLNYRVIDTNGNIFKVNADVSSWSPGEQHHVAASWVLNSRTQQDEMHLFIDGQETSNILTYGSHISPLLHQKFRTISTEDIIGESSRPIVSSVDLTTSIGSNLVSSSLNFTSLGIAVSDTIYIEETGFNSLGYTITNVNGNTLTLSTTAPLSASNCRFSINKISFTIDTQINLYNNIAVSVIHSTISDSDLTTTATSNIVSSASYNFTTAGISTGDLIRVNESGFADYYTIVSVSNNSLTLSDNMPLSTSNSDFLVYSNTEYEIPGQNALFPSYEISRDGYYNNVLTLRSNIEKDDIILIRTLGLNHGRVKNKYYIWGNSSNIINTRLPSPIALEDVKIYHTLLDTLSIGPSNSTLSLGTFTSNNLLTDQPSISSNGRTLSVTISGDNIDYSSNVLVAIHGTIDGIPASIETVSFSENSTQSTLGKVSLVSYIVVTCKPIISTRNCVTVKIKELETITTAENSVLVPVIRYSYQMLVGNTLSGTIGSPIITDAAIQFSKKNIGNYLVIYSPISVAGQYLITDISTDLLSATLNSNLSASFIDGNYEVLNVSEERSGFQNGKFTFEESSTPGTPYLLSQGLYELDYHTGLSIKLEAGISRGFVGSDMDKKNQAKSIIDDFYILDTKLSDTRIGETLASGADSITKQYNSLKAMKPSSNTLMLLDFDTLDTQNNSSVYLTSTKEFIQSSTSVNSNFGKSIVFNKAPYLVNNTGILNTRAEGTIEFWTNPLTDTGNDPNYRFYFDATSAVTEEVISNTNASVVIVGRASTILSVKLKHGNKDFDYFAGGSISSDLQTLLLRNKLPNQNTSVIVTYIPNGVAGDRISIYKDPSGYINFTISGSGTDHQVRAPIYWRKGSWHKIRAQYKVNKGLGFDEMRFFIDGYETGNILFGSGLLFGENVVFGSSFIGHNSDPQNISFTDTINEFSIGSDYTGTHSANSLIDNLRISGISRPIFSPFGESLDVGYSSNLEVVYPATEDLYTTLLLDFNKLIGITTDFSVLKNHISGLFDITVNIFDSFGILEANGKSKLVMEELLLALRPANSRLFLNYK